MRMNTELLDDTLDAIFEETDSKDSNGNESEMEELETEIHNQLFIAFSTKKPSADPTDKQVMELQQYIDSGSKLYYGLFTNKVKSLAYQYASKNQRKSQWAGVNVKVLQVTGCFFHFSPRRRLVFGQNRVTNFSRNNIVTFFTNFGRVYNKFKL
ncbi:hypothetical protein AVEN_143529-1 [Araneus ventricosus]|uniref:Uncharacterized protein n=1 Tax=Araneus ventricosus TaxID=182803 RepID=A0A4Y2SS14_ARAVE|nr:hypothetical protein AVEN_211472-1 [Araneus ventricosus]GBN89989.1 hypothetical protein AVEN_143529-1 [Araneus ventricosus]